MASNKMDMLNLEMKRLKKDPNKCALLRIGGQIPERPFKEVKGADLAGIFGDEAKVLVLVEYKDKD